MPKMIRSILIGNDMVSREEIKMVYLPAAERVLSVVKDIFKTEGVLEQYFFEVDVDGKKKTVCFCYESAPNESARPNQERHFQRYIRGAVFGCGVLWASPRV